MKIIFPIFASTWLAASWVFGQTPAYPPVATRPVAETTPAPRQFNLGPSAPSTIPPATNSPAAPPLAPPSTPRDTRFRLPEDSAPAVPASGAKGGGDLLIERVAKTLDAHQAIIARLRQRVDLFGRQLIGTGRYLQQESAVGRQVRLELKNGIGEEITTLEQVCDGKYLWQFSDLREEPIITRIDMLRVRQALAENPRRAAAVSMTDLGLYGLPALIDGLRRTFRFDRVEAGKLDVMPVWVLTGTWQPDALEFISKDLAKQAVAGERLDLKKLPPQVPEEVQLYVGQDDLFPYRIEFRRRPSSQGRGGKGADDSSAPLAPVVIVELYEVRLNAPIDPRHFEYQPGKLEWYDATENYLKPLRPKKVDSDDDKANE